MESYSNSFLIRVFFFPFKFKINKKIFDKKKKTWDLGARKGNSIKKKLKTFNQESGPIYHQEKQKVVLFYW